jgi:hypothetical protein
MGEAVVSVLNASMGAQIAHPKQEEWPLVFAPMLKLAGAGSLENFERDALCCGLMVEGGILRIVPHRKIGNVYRGFSKEAIMIAFDSSSVELAAAIGDGFKRCLAVVG